MTTTRQAMTDYWSTYEPTLESMMLDNNAEILTREEQEEIVSYLPDYSHKDVLELGAGIGRFTSVIAKKARRVTAVDFIPDFLLKNKQSNGHRSNVSFVHTDVTCLEQPNESWDVIFTNWLLMYLNDDEVQQLVTKMLSWLKVGGFLFVRESCFHPSGKGVSRPEKNPTFYRDPAFYTRVLQAPDKHTSVCFQLMKATSLKTYVKFKNNPNQLCYLLRKVPCNDSTEADAITPGTTYHNFQQFLDENQYTRRGIEVYEAIFGQNFVSTGGLDTTREFLERLKLKSGERVLDVGCGIGGSAFFMAKDHNAKVHGVDLSANMISIALERQIREVANNKVCFEICDITEQDFPSETYDVIYSRDTILHIANKEQLFTNFRKWLKPGGRLLITDYCRGRDPQLGQSKQFNEYVASRGYHLLTVAKYRQLLEASGFREVVADDRTKQFIEILHAELEKFTLNKASFFELFTETDYQYIVDGWRSKVDRCSDGDQSWGLFTALK